MKKDAAARNAPKDTSDNDTPVIVARDLVKRFGALEAVRGVSFQVEQGRCIGLLGPNGAGKTTIMRMIVGQSTVTAGELNVFGEPPYRLSREIKARIGLVPQADNLDPDVSVQENLEIYGRYFGLPEATIDARVPDLLEFMRLEEKADARVSQLSGGMKRRLVIARALIAEPEVVILDEPTTGLDPQARVMIWKQLLALKARGKTMLLTTHYMDEAQRLCDRIIIIDHGEILDEGSPEELISRHVKGHVYEIDKPVPEPLKNGRWDSEDIGDSVLIYVQQQDDIRPALTKDTSYYHRPANLEDVFLRLTGRQLRET
ncbi:ATP-binding cassette domain-containing protein [Dichotomicrobium thermohalophilum]|uniref:Nodulation factor export ABC transporter ATP-binding protein NodI n=1 Tax=Dichotomicrobium thermohalophilum TaxID=933063 RepID=A0A397Q0U8_9HYPH|nr:ATP-binding cassette domain-containing protein [Dichotomicrobium thermohalophilum]RIA55026.1 nodulation factor export ABC transporter ATP-binding protein NodI [Dichotomicrobium thermohalophilum]